MQVNKTRRFIHIYTQYWQNLHWLSEKSLLVISNYYNEKSKTKTFHATGLFLYQLKTSENQKFSDIDQWREMDWELLRGRFSPVTRNVPITASFRKVSQRFSCTINRSLTKNSQFPTNFFTFTKFLSRRLQFLSDF